MRVKPAVLLLLVAFAPLGASPQPLNPLVPRVANDVSAPPECAEGAAPRSEPRIIVAEIPMPEPEAQFSASTPPANLGGLFRDLQTAIARDDRRLFDDSLARLRATLAGHPSGAEKNAALAAARAYEDVGRLWDAQFESPFFGEDSDAYRAASAYPGWAEAVRRNVLIDDRDRRFYPARESRQYLAGIATRAIGGRASTSVATADDDEPSRALPSVKPKRRPGKVESHTATATPKPTSPKTTSPKVSTSRQGSAATSRIASASPAPPPATRTAPVSTPEPVRATPPPPAVDPAATTTTAEPAPPAEPEPTTTTTADAPSPTTTTVSTEPPTTTVEPAPATGTTTTAAPATTDRGRRLIVPLILILVGIGVLIVLFRAST